MLQEDTGEWTSVAASLDVTLDRLLMVKQVHGIHVAVARPGKTDGWTRPQADAIVTNDPAVAIGVRVADCAPVLLFDRRTNAVGAVHAGWRGAAANAVPAGVGAMTREFQTDPPDLVAAIGPCLGECCGEVGPDVVEAFRAGGASQRDIDAWFHPGAGDRSMLDLERANRDQLERAGVRPENIFASGLCTRTSRDRLHSYRADRNAAGRMLAAIRCAR